MPKLTQGDKAEIHRLSETMKKPTASKVARKLGLGRGSVSWYMMTHGLLEVPLRGCTRPNHCLPAHDARIQQLRVEGLNNSAIGRVITKEFGIPRDGHSVRYRLARLAIVPDEADGVRPTATQPLRARHGSGFTRRPLADDARHTRQEHQA
jgi:hypothetical protein